MERLLIPIDFDQQLEEVPDDAAKWRLVNAMLHYCRGDELPELGTEKMVWGVIKKMCDDWKAYCEKQSRNGRQPKSQSKPTKAKRSQNKPEEAKESQSEPTLHNITLHNTTLHDITQQDNEPTALEIALGEFKQYRKEMKKPLTPLAETKLMNQLQTLSNGDEAVMVQIIDQSIRNGWQGVFPLKDQKTIPWQRKPAFDYQQRQQTNDEWTEMEKRILVNLDED